MTYQPPHRSVCAAPRKPPRARPTAAEIRASIASSPAVVAPPSQKPQKSELGGQEHFSIWPWPLKLLVMIAGGVGVGLFVGMLMLSSAEPESTAVKLGTETAQMGFTVDPLKGAVNFPIKAPIQPLQTQINEAIATYPQGRVGVFILDLDKGDYVNVRGQESFIAASTIKLPILAMFYQQVDQGRIDLDELLTMTAELRASEAGNMQFSPVGTQFSALETATRMITISDNTGTNMIIQRLGGNAALNSQFQRLGLGQTTLKNWLPDIAGMNTTTPIDLTNVLIGIEQGQFISMRSRDRILRTLSEVNNRQLLPQGLGNGAVIAHKTGTLGKVLADVGLVDTPKGARYIITVIVERPHGDPQAQTLIHQISRLAYDHFNR